MASRPKPLLPNPGVPVTNPKTGELTVQGRAFWQAVVDAMVIGPQSATDGATVLFDGTTGTKVKQ